MKSTRLLLSAVLLLVCCGCLHTSLIEPGLHGCSLGVTQSAKVGVPIVIEQTGTAYKKEKGFKYMGFGHLPVVKYPARVWEEYPEGVVRKELIYSGISGQKITFIEKTVLGGSIVRTTYQGLDYDVAELRVVPYRQYFIEIFDASPETLTYRVTKQ